MPSQLQRVTLIMAGISAATAPFYSFNILPQMGQMIAGDADSYRYLAESIRMHPDQETLKGMMEQAGLVNCKYQNMTGGVVALHTGIKP